MEDKVFLSLTIEELRTVIYDSVIKCLKQWRPAEQEGVPNNRLVPVNVATKRTSPQYLGSRTFIYQLQKKGVIKFKYIGTKPYIDLEEYYNSLTDKPSN